MKLSMCSANYGKTDLREVIFRAAQLGFDGIELTVMFHTPPTLDGQERKRIAGWLAEAGIACSALHYIFDPRVKMSSLEANDSAFALNALKQVVDLADDLGAPTIIVGGGGTRSFKEAQTRESVADHLARLIRLSGEYALPRNITLAIEALNRYETNYIRTLEDASNFAEAVQLPNVRIMGDTYHMNIEESSIEEAIVQFGGRLAHLHLADSNRLAPGFGHIDFGKVVGALRTIGYDQYCSIEVFCIRPDLMYVDSYEEADRQMAEGLSHMRRIVNGE